MSLLNLILDVAVWPMFVLGAMLIIAPVVVIVSIVILVVVLNRKKKSSGKDEHKGEDQ